MLNIFLGEMKDAIYHPPTYFDNVYEDEWITDPLSIEMIRDIDKSDVIGVHLIESPVLGPISPKDLSGGVKTLMLMAFADQEKVFNASACGDNCAKWILKIGYYINHMYLFFFYHLFKFFHIPSIIFNIHCLDVTYIT